jgi:tetratricopeptide (TPR) repeat protein
MMLVALDRLDEADELLRRGLRTAEALGDDESASRALEGLGLIASRRGRFERAVELLEQSLARAADPDPEERFELYRELARLHGEGTNLPRSIELLEGCLQAMREKPERDPARMVGYTVYLSYAYVDQGDYGHATAVLTEALREDAEDIDRATRSTAYRALSRLYALTGQAPLALEYAGRGLEAALETRNEWEHANAHLLLAHVLLDDGQADAAGRELEAARRAYGDRMSGMDEGFVAVEEARRSLQQGDPEGAAALAREAIELLGNLSVPGELGEAYLVLARSYDETGKSDRAEAAYTTAIDALRRQNGWHCELGRAYRWYGKFLRGAGRTEAAMEAFEQAADLAPSNHDRPDRV